uniref:Uncharacterized protein n=1 Tax=Arundo donax TaxID=35708 RepID=A0A0A9EC33_ARUDO
MDNKLHIATRANGKPSHFSTMSLPH